MEKSARLERQRGLQSCFQAMLPPQGCTGLRWLQSSIRFHAQDRLLTHHRASCSACSSHYWLFLWFRALQACIKLHMLLAIPHSSAPHGNSVTGIRLVLYTRLCPCALPSNPAPRMKLCSDHANSLFWVQRSCSNSRLGLWPCCQLRCPQEHLPAWRLAQLLRPGFPANVLPLLPHPAPFSRHLTSPCFDSDAKAPLDHTLPALSQSLWMQSSAYQPELSGMGLV